MAAPLRAQLGATLFAEVDTKHVYLPRQFPAYPKDPRNTPYPACHFYVARAQGRDLTLDLTGLKQMARRAQKDIETHLKTVLNTKEMKDFQRQLETSNRLYRKALGPITDEEQRVILQHIEEPFIAEGWRRRRLA